MQPPDTSSLNPDGQLRRTLGMRLQVVVVLLLISVVMVSILGAQCQSLCSSETGMQSSGAVRQRAVVDQANPQTVNVWVDVMASGVFSPALTSPPTALVSLEDGDQEQGLPAYLDDLAQKGYVAIRVPHAPPDYNESSLVPGISSTSPEAVEFTYYMPPDATDETTIVVPIKRVTAYETIVNQRYPITDGKSHWEVWWIDDDKFPVPDGTFRLKKGWPEPFEVMFRIDFGAGADATVCAGCPFELLVYNGYTFIGPFHIPLIIEYLNPPPPGNPLVTFDMQCDEASRVQYISPMQRFTHTHWLGNYDLVTRTFTVTADSSQGWAYGYYYGEQGEALSRADGKPFTVTLGPGSIYGSPECMAIAAVFTPTITVSDTLRETLSLSATSVVSPEVQASTASVALAPGYQLDEEAAGNRTYLPAY
jgi:hypothetical protein